MVTHAELVSAFGSLWVETMPPEVAEQHFANPDDRRLLTEVGMPQSLLGQLYFGNVRTDSPQTISQFLDTGTPDMFPTEVRDDIVIAAGMGGVACMSRADNRIYWYEPGSSERKFGLVNTSLERFLETAYQLRLKFKGLDLLYSEDEDEMAEEIGDAVRRLVGEIRDIEPASFDSPAMFWQHVVLFAVETLASQG
ncbi:SUKH-4 family immunity protein [Micromonospora sp. NBC_01655]|uniref:SUKH-4 family immunity protein n=1 Tax=Micromonospora sp. NBC_01655 TaxID=2975983 RepID=UPI00224ED251|nr:SUKH-4 family immunity protein [Micromonospora sp. NBC_01655]MCX4473535.1 SUKH-4 family immunity protein [Micromonospora sp. NBC_01655]